MQANQPDFMVFTGNANPGMAAEIAKHLAPNWAQPMWVASLTVKSPSKSNKTSVLAMSS